jgi:cholinesterase
MIFVALNYRLGAFGFLAGPEVERDGTQNAGLYDQRLALDWIQLNIPLFGGSPERVTVIGEYVNIALQIICNRI